MTISYSGNFARLLIRWKGSVWKTTWKELTVFLSCYYLIRILYRYTLPVEHKVTLEQIIMEFDGYTKRIPLTFILGFYVATVVKRWWEQFQYVAWPDACLHALCFFMTPSDANDAGTITRLRTIARYLNLCSCLAYRDLSARVRKRFPSLEHLVNAELMTQEELSIHQQSVDCVRWFLPLQWAQHLVEEFCRIRQVPAPYVIQFLTRLNDYRLSFHKLFCYDWICIPLVYTQVSALATYGYFFMCLVGRQFIEHRSTSSFTVSNSSSENFSTPAPCTVFCNDYYVPVFSILEFLFYVGWFKVGQDLMRPFDEDDDDYELNVILDRNIKVSVAIVSSVIGQKPNFPPNESLAVWEDAHAADIPYTVWCRPDRNHPPKMHAYVKIIENGSNCVVLKQRQNQSPDSVTPIQRKKTKRWRYF